MVLFKGSTRIFNTPVQEDSSSISTLRVLSIYGVTDYTQLSGKTIDVISYIASGDSMTVNINNLGVKDVYIYLNGVQQNVMPSNLLGAGQIYTLYYNGVNFIIVSIDGAESSIQSISENILSLTSSSTSSDILNAFGSSAEILATKSAIANGKLLVISTEGLEVDNLIVLSYSRADMGMNSYNDTIIVLIPSSKIIKTLEFQFEGSGVYTAVTVTETGTGGVMSSDNSIDDIVTITQAAYDALVAGNTVDTHTLYNIVG